MAGRQAMATILRTLFAATIAASGVTPVQAGVSAPRIAFDEATFSRLLLKVQSVDPGDSPEGNSVDAPASDRGGERYEKERTERPRRFEQVETDRIVQDLLSIRRECSEYDTVYRIDCLRQGIEQTLMRISDRPENKEARQILRRASRQLATIVTTYADDSAPLLESPNSANPRFKKRRTYRAVKRDSLPTAMARADALVTEAATQLLRSAENSERRYAHYQQISAAVDSTKTLLRSG